MATQTSIPERTMLTAPQAAEYLGIGHTKTYEMIAHNELPGVIRIGRLVRIHRPTLDDWLEEQARGVGTSR
ncbi:MAG: helix-turn-helix domain-containing protein [Chloroflexia bacterium]